LLQSNTGYDIFYVVRIMTHPDISQQITFLYTKDLVSTAHFYEDVMGLDLVLDQGACRIYQITSDSYLGFCCRGEIVPEHRDVIFTLVTPHVDEWFTYLQSRGVVIDKPPSHNPEYKIYHCFLRDPNGYLLEIQRFDDPDWYQKEQLGKSKP
jgi:catechol 2,3-dioxygenase-like lactoylglutathione lyase family enzyme